MLPIFASLVIASIPRVVKKGDFEDRELANCMHASASRAHVSRWPIAGAHNE